jgi:hypothetical protein
MFDLPPVSLATLRGEPPPAPVYPFQLPLSYPLAAYPAFPTGYLANGDSESDPDLFRRNEIVPKSVDPSESVVAPLPGPEPEPPEGIAPVPRARRTRKPKTKKSPDDSASQTPALPLELKEPRKKKNMKTPPVDGEPVEERGRRAERAPAAPRACTTTGAPVQVLQKAEKKLQRAQEDIEKEILQTEKALRAVKETVAAAEKDVLKAETSRGQRERQPAAAPREKQAAAAAPTDEPVLCAIGRRISSLIGEISLELAKAVDEPKVNLRKTVGKLSRISERLRKMFENNHISEGTDSRNALLLIAWTEYMAAACNRHDMPPIADDKLREICTGLSAAATAVCSGEPVPKIGEDRAKDDIMKVCNLQIIQFVSEKTLVDSASDLETKAETLVPGEVGEVRSRRLARALRGAARGYAKDPLKNDERIQKTLARAKVLYNIPKRVKTAPA